MLKAILGLFSRQDKPQATKQPQRELNALLYSYTGYDSMAVIPHY